MAEVSERKQFSFVGRASRARYWICMAVYMAAYIGAWLLAPILGFPQLLVAVVLPPIWIIFIAVPRLHDFGRSGWWGLVPFGFGFLVGLGSVLAHVLATLEASNIKNAIIGVVSIAATIAIGAVPGTKGDNVFGPAPGKRPVAEAFG